MLQVGAVSSTKDLLVWFAGRGEGEMSCAAVLPGKQRGWLGAL